MQRLATLIPTATDPRTRLAMLRLFFEQSRFSLAAAVLLVGLQAVYAAGHTPLAVVAAWLLFSAGLIATRWRWRQHFLALGDAAQAAAQATWERRALGGSAATGLRWVC